MHRSGTFNKLDTLAPLEEEKEQAVSHIQTPGLNLDIQGRDLRTAKIELNNQEYSFKQHLDKGSFGACAVLENEETHQKIVLKKQINAELHRTKGEQFEHTLFAKEAKLYETVRGEGYFVCPNEKKHTDAEEDAYCPHPHYIVYRYIEGTRLDIVLSDILTRAQSADMLEQSVLYAKQITLALLVGLNDFHRKHNLVHADIRTPNLLLKHLEDGQVQAIPFDFGCTAKQKSKVSNEEIGKNILFMEENQTEKGYIEFKHDANNLGWILSAFCYELIEQHGEINSPAFSAICEVAQGLTGETQVLKEPKQKAKAPTITLETGINLLNGKHAKALSLYSSVKADKDTETLPSEEEIDKQLSHCDLFSCKIL